jgi:hypothetical protein
VNSLRIWIVLLALLSFAAGGAAGTLAAASFFRPAPEPGPFTQYERDLTATFELSPERAALLHVLMEDYRHQIERIQSSHVADTLSAMEPELARIGRSYRERIRVKVLPPGKRAQFDDPSLVVSWNPPR